MKTNPDVRAAGITSVGVPSHMNSGSRLIHGKEGRLTLNVERETQVRLSLLKRERHEPDFNHGMRAQKCSRLPPLCFQASLIVTQGLSGPAGPDRQACSSCRHAL